MSVHIAEGPVAAARASRTPRPGLPVASLAAVLAVVAFAVAAATGPVALSLVLGAAVVLYVPASALDVVAARYRVDLGLAISTGITTAVVLLGSTAMATTGFWHPTTFAAAYVGVSLAVHLYLVAEAATNRQLRLVAPRARAWLRPSELRGLSAGVLAATIAATILCVLELQRVHLDSGHVPFAGYLAVVGWGWFAGLAVLALSVGYWTWRGYAPGLLLSGLALVSVLFAAPLIAYNAPRSQSAEKHVVIVRAIIAHGDLNGIASIYKSWPGFFTATAMFLQGAGAERTLPELAATWPLILALLTFALVSSIVRRVGYPTTTAYLVATVASVANVLQQDYFSPQSVGYVLALSLLAVVVRFLPLSADAPQSGRAPAVLLVAALAIAGGIAVTHQFTPFAVGASVVVVFLWGLVKPIGWSLRLGAVVVAPPVVWALAHWSAVHGFVSPSQLGDASNFKPPTTDTGSGLSRMTIVPVSSAALAAVIALVGVVALVAVLRRRRSRSSYALATAVLAPFLLIVVSPYGNEGIFRATLLALPWLVIIGLPEYTRAATSKSATAHWVIAIGCLLVVAGYSISSAGLDASTVTRRADVAAYTQIETTAAGDPARPVVAIQVLGGDLPTSTTGTHNLSLLRPKGALPTLADDATAQDYLAELAQEGVQQVGSDRNPIVFLIFSPASVAYEREYGLGRQSDIDRVDRAMVNSPFLAVVTEQDGTILGRFAPVS